MSRDKYSNNTSSGYFSVHHNIVYCGYDPEGKIRYAGMRGTADLYGKKFKMDVPGNDKNYGVNIVRKESVDLKVFESVIDCMSSTAIR